MVAVSEAEAPHAPWALSGECVVGFAPCRRSTRSALPEGIHPLPGPEIISAASFDCSTTGAYLELAVGEPAHLGARPGWCITTMAVNSVASRLGGRLNWGFPKELGVLEWSADGDERTLYWNERNIVVRGVPSGPAFPVLLPLRALQRRADGPVVIPGHLRGRARLARVTVEAPVGDPLAHLAGRHRGVLISSLRLAVDPARHPAGRRATLLAPLRAPEPALTWARRPRPAITGD